MSARRQDRRYRLIYVALLCMAFASITVFCRSQAATSLTWGMRTAAAEIV